MDAQDASTCDWYSSASIRLSTCAASVGRSSISHPSPYGSLLISSGVYSSASLRATTVPATGA